MSVEVITKDALVQLRRHARLEKKKESERALNTTLRDVIQCGTPTTQRFALASLKAARGTKHNRKNPLYQSCRATKLLARTSTRRTSSCCGSHGMLVLRLGRLRGQTEQTL